jgi:hypothetical protein
MLWQARPCILNITAAYFVLNQACSVESTRHISCLGVVPEVYNKHLRHADTRWLAEAHRGACMFFFADAQF